MFAELGFQLAVTEDFYCHNVLTWFMMASIDQGDFEEDILWLHLGYLPLKWCVASFLILQVEIKFLLPMLLLVLLWVYLQDPTNISTSRKWSLSIADTERVSCINAASKLVLAVPWGGLLQVKSFLMSFPTSAIEHLVYFSVKYPIWNFVELVLVLNAFI